MGVLDGKVAVITGGTRGLGLAIAHAYQAQGAAVVIGSRQADSVEAALSQLTQAGRRAAGLAVDVADGDQIRRLGRLALEQFGGVDIWVNNAGLSAPYGATMHVDPHDFAAVVQTNILGPTGEAAKRCATFFHAAAAS